MSGHFFLDYCDIFGYGFGTSRLLFSLFIEIKSNIFISVYFIIIIEASYSFSVSKFFILFKHVERRCIVYYSMVISNCCHPYLRPIYLGKNPTKLSDKCKHQPLVVKEQTDRGLN